MNQSELFVAGEKRAKSAFGNQCRHGVYNEPIRVSSFSSESLSLNLMVLLVNRVVVF